MPGPDLSDLRAGDCLLYYTHHDLVDFLIAFKTWTFVAHMEIYEGAGKSVASRNGIGVDRYDLRTKGLVGIRRPIGILDIEAATQWFETKARHQKYDWLGLAVYYLAARHGSPNRMYCSEFGTRWYRNAAFNPVDPDWDADRTPPMLYLPSTAFSWIYSAPGLVRRCS